LAKVVVFEMHGGGTELENDGGILEAQAAFFNRFVRILGLAVRGGERLHDIGFEALIKALTTMDYNGQQDVLIAGGGWFPAPSSIPGNLYYYDYGWYEFEGGIGKEGSYLEHVNDLVFYDDKLIVTGNFALVGDGGLQANGIAYWDGAWNKLDNGLDDEGMALHIDARKKTLYVGGDISETGTSETENLGQYIFPRTPGPRK